MQKQGFSRREFLSLAGATGGVALHLSHQLPPQHRQLACLIKVRLPMSSPQAVAPAAESGGTEASM